MTSEGARELIPLYRPGKPMDARVMKAVRFAEGDDELRGEMQWQIAFDDEVVEVIHVIRPPENLRQKLDEIAQPADAPAPSRVRQNVFNPAVLSVICGLLVLVGVGVFLKMESAKDFAGRSWAESMLELNDKMSGAELEPTKMLAGELSDNLMLRGFDRFALPPELNNVPALGWRVFRHSGNKVVQIALDREGPGQAANRGVIVFVFRASDFGVHPGEEGAWKVFDHEVWAAAATERKGLCTLVSFRGVSADMEAFLKTLKP